MPAIIKRLCENGLEDVGYTADSLKDAARYESKEGVYTVSNTYNRTQTLLLDAHLDRLEDSAKRERIPLSYDRRRLRRAIRQMIDDAEFGDVRFRITVESSAPREILLTIEPFSPPAAVITQNGVRCMTSSAAARHNPASKSSDWMHRRGQLVASTPPGIYETFLLDAKGYLLEGMSSNFYAIEDGTLHTAGSGVLAGISRMIVFEIARDIIPLRLEAPQVSAIPRFSEAFLTSSSRGIIPVVEIDGLPIGDGAVGETTVALTKAYQRWVADHLEEL